MKNYVIACAELFDYTNSVFTVEAEDEMAAMRECWQYYLGGLLECREDRPELWDYMMSLSTIKAFKQEFSNHEMIVSDPQEIS